MKRRKQSRGRGLILLALLLLGPDSRAADPISPAKAMELALHRLEFLVALPASNPKHVPREYMERLHTILLEKLPPAEDGEPAFRAELAQYPPASPSEGARRIAILLDAQGKTSKFKHVMLPGGEPSDPPAWPERDATTLAENALHFVLENAPVKPDVAPFDRGVTRLRLTAAKAPGGQLLAVIEFETAVSEPRLQVRLRADGTFVDYEIKKRIATYDSIRKEIFVPRCLQCHAAGKEAEDVLLTPYAALMESSRELVLPGNSEESRLLMAVVRGDKKRMPPPEEGAPLDAGEIETIRSWIDEGAKGP